MEDGEVQEEAVPAHTNIGRERASTGEQVPPKELEGCLGYYLVLLHQVPGGSNSGGAMEPLPTVGGGKRNFPPQTEKQGRKAIQFRSSQRC